jgi:SAM-dependent methyltransferase
MESALLPLLFLCWNRPASSWNISPRDSRRLATPRSIHFAAPPLLAQPLTHGDAAKTKSIYSMPALYDLAFGYRDYDEEVAFLLSVHARLAGRPAASVLELAAGPARHSLTALSTSGGSVQSAIAIDLSKEMALYARDIAATDYANLPHQLDYRVADMRTFSLNDDDDHPTTKTDTAWILLGSLQHLTENSDIIQCFQSVHRALSDDGTLIIELPHPRETFSMVKCTRNGWKVPLEDDAGDACGELKIIWGDENDDFDPIRQVRQFTVSMQVTGTQDLQSVREIVPLRLFTAMEMDALARGADMRVVEMFGALEEGVSIDDDKAAYRLVCVLQKSNRHTVH